jgi:hypothetical protein
MISFFIACVFKELAIVTVLFAMYDLLLGVKPIR